MAGRMVVSIMQPYFAPYAGYYRLLAAADIFVLYDCVQFTRRGWIHRNRLPDAKGEPVWLTLPLKPAPFDASIDSLVFADDAAERMAERVRGFPSLAAHRAAADAFLHAAPMAGSLVDYLEAQLEQARALLGAPRRLIRSSTLNIDAALRGQDRILAILGALEATHYVNAPGGRGLYDAADFSAQGVELRFLPDYEGPMWSLLHRLATEEPTDLRAEILGQTPTIRGLAGPRA